MKTVVVGLSGGVDSSVAAHLLVEEGYNVIGIFMKNWHDESVTISDECPWIDDSQDALLVAEKLGIPFQVLDLSAEYRERIVNYMFSEYEQGRTPNPDVLCNREIKFDVFLEAAKKLGADYIATGHYCQRYTSEDGIHHLLAGADPNKDQSYFLCQLTQEQLAKSLFPIGKYQKSEVREIAKQYGFVTAEKKDSQGLCFVGKVKLPVFLQQQLKPKKGKIVNVDNNDAQFSKYQENINAKNYLKLAEPFEFSETSGEVVGEHNGAHYFTIGQRKGLGVGGFKEPLFVIDTDTASNTVFVGEGESHKGLNRKVVFVKKDAIHWIREDLALKEKEETDQYIARVRYRQPLTKVEMHMHEEGLYFIFEKMMKGIAPGQFIAWYSKDGELIGSGVIHS
ncbi:MAG: tRNA 2-thiouridine(34) synthase MnmA [Crocinitomicaceae bacterium]|nr:tRNA 2-thiouridine(34) synthase MnmA [Crocinitomicaceae bacterium]